MVLFSTDASATAKQDDCNEKECSAESGDTANQSNPVVESARFVYEVYLSREYSSLRQRSLTAIWLAYKHREN